MYAKTIRDGLVTVLEEMTGAGKTFGRVYAYGEAQPKDFPCAMIKIVSPFSKVRVDSARDRVTFRYLIRVLINAENTADEEDLILEIVDAVILKFMEYAKVDTLNNLVDDLTLGSGNILSDDSGGPVRGAEFLIEASKLIPITSA